MIEEEENELSRFQIKQNLLKLKSLVMRFYFYRQIY